MYLRRIGEKTHGQFPLLHEEHVRVAGDLGDLVTKLFQLLLTDLSCWLCTTEEDRRKRRAEQRNKQRCSGKLAQISIIFIMIILLLRPKHEEDGEEVTHGTTGDRVECVYWMGAPWSGTLRG